MDEEDTRPRYYANGEMRYGFVTYNKENHSIERFMSGEEIKLGSHIKVPAPPNSLDALWKRFSNNGKGNR